VSAYLEVRRVAPPRAGFLSRFVIKHSDNEHSILQEVCRRIISDFGKDITLETMVQLFEFVVSPADRIVTGAIYTPIRIRKAIIANCLNNMTIEELQMIHAADISCGCGGFLMDMALLIHQKTGKTYSEIYRENIYGIDIQPYAIERTKILLSMLALIGGEDEDFEFNLICRDSLDVREDGWDGRYRNFDVIIGNPPYVCSRNLTDETLEKLKRYEVCRTGHPDLYIPFFQIALEMLSDNGRMGYITMNTFLRSVNGRALRFYLSNQGYSISIIDFRGYQVFESRNTYTCLFFLNKADRTRTIR
jgi:type I restriction-modification system DNA methylase subunit